ncbi:hypothetical protein BC828DRAFT_372181 [Blastocladiella britannica]|nr:hypothetical protein BC828DRAFT_372181 [Blastocladiella britannica]
MGTNTTDPPPQPIAAAAAGGGGGIDFTPSMHGYDDVDAQSSISLAHRHRRKPLVAAAAPAPTTAAADPAPPNSQPPLTALTDVRAAVRAERSRRHRLHRPAVTISKGEKRTRKQAEAPSSNRPHAMPTPAVKLRRLTLVPQRHDLPDLAFTRTKPPVPRRLPTPQPPPIRGPTTTTNLPAVVPPAATDNPVQTKPSSPSLVVAAAAVEGAPINADVGKDDEIAALDRVLSPLQTVAPASPDHRCHSPVLEDQLRELATSGPVYRRSSGTGSVAWPVFARSWPYYSSGGVGSSNYSMVSSSSNSSAWRPRPISASPWAPRPLSAAMATAAAARRQHGPWLWSDHQ